MSEICCCSLFANSQAPSKQAEKNQCSTTDKILSVIGVFFILLGIVFVTLSHYYNGPFGALGQTFTSLGALPLLFSFVHNLFSNRSFSTEEKKCIETTNASLTNNKIDIITNLTNNKPVKVAAGVYLVAKPYKNH